MHADITEINPDEMTATNKAIVTQLQGINIEQTLETDLKSAETKFPVSFHYLLATLIQIVNHATAKNPRVPFSQGHCML